MRFVLRGHVLDLERRDIERGVRGAEPEQVRKHAVEVTGRIYPVKQVLRLVLAGRSPELSTLDFTSGDARSILRRLGFRLFAEGPGATETRRRR